MQLSLPFFDPPVRRPAVRPMVRPPRSSATGAGRAAPAIDPISTRIVESTRRLATVAERIFGTDLSDWSVHCDLRGMSAGQVQIHRRRIRFNPAMAAAQPEDFLRTTIAHELAHVVCHLLHGRQARPHGEEWQQICLALGGDGARCHGFAASPARQVRQFAYACGCRTWSISSVRVQRIRRGVRYHCRACGQVLRAANQQAERKP